MPDDLPLEAVDTIVYDSPSERETGGFGSTDAKKEDKKGNDDDDTVKMIDDDEKAENDDGVSSDNKDDEPLKKRTKTVPNDFVFT